MSRLTEPLRRIVGPATAKVFANSFGVETVADLLRHYPRRYAERGELTDLASLRVGEDVTVLARVREAKLHRFRNRPGSRVEVTVTDGRGELLLTFFNQPKRLHALQPGRLGLFAGKVDIFNKRRQLAHPDYELLPDDKDEATRAAAEFADTLIPVYPSTKGFATWRIAKAVQTALDTLGDVPDPLPGGIRDRYGLLGLREALITIHRPRTRAHVARARHRLAWDEAFVLQVELAKRRSAARALPAVPRHVRSGGILSEFDKRLPFALTAGQREVAREIEGDLARSFPMHRLLQGEVGSGKTVVALRAMLTVIDAGGQAALLAPTEVLAQQHYRSVTDLLGPLAMSGQLGGAEDATRAVLLTGSQPAAARRAALLDVVSGRAGIVIGTHALLEEKVRFLDLGLVVVDEQHRFGVEQRARLTGKSDLPAHLLVMTATPIPRTVAMTVFGDLDVSTLTELPVGRSPIATHVVPVREKPAYLDRTWQRVREEVAAGNQAYVVCPRIGDGIDGEEADTDDAPTDLDDETGTAGDARSRPPLAVLDVAPGLPDGPLAGLRVEVLHGRLPADTKDDVMRRFAAAAIDVLVATTVIEVGVDVPNATAMVIMDAERFGVAQLHQLRGRVGRGQMAGLCLLVTESPDGTRARERLSAVAATTDGFELSRLDLEHRREGDVLGAVQSGRRSSLRLLAVLRDEDLIQEARSAAATLVEADPDLSGHPLVAAALAELVDPQQADYLEKT